MRPEPAVRPYEPRQAQELVPEVAGGFADRSGVPAGRDDLHERGHVARLERELFADDAGESARSRPVQLPGGRVAVRRAHRFPEDVGIGEPQEATPARRVAIAEEPREHGPGGFPFGFRPPARGVLVVLKRRLRVRGGVPRPGVPGPDAAAGGERVQAGVEVPEEWRILCQQGPDQFVGRGISGGREFLDGLQELLPQLAVLLPAGPRPDAQQGSAVRRPARGRLAHELGHLPDTAVPGLAWHAEHVARARVPFRGLKHLHTGRRLPRPCGLAFGQDDERGCFDRVENGPVRFGRGNREGDVGGGGGCGGQGEREGEAGAGGHERSPGGFPKRPSRREMVPALRGELPGNIRNALRTSCSGCASARSLVDGEQDEGGETRRRIGVRLHGAIGRPGLRAGRATSLPRRGSPGCRTSPARSSPRSRPFPRRRAGWPRR